MSSLDELFYLYRILKTNTEVCVSLSHPGLSMSLNAIAYS